MSSDSQTTGGSVPKDALPGTEITGRETTRPALDILQRNQRELVFDGNTDRTPELTPITADDGFKNRRGLINWYQAAQIRTFGHIAREWPPHDIVRDERLASALVGPPADDGEQWLRSQLVEQVVLPACRTAYRHLREKATERVNADNSTGGEDKWQQVVIDREKHVAMRPGFSRLDAAQADALDELWGGLENRDTLARWLHSLHPATYGEYGGNQAEQICTDLHAVARFTKADEKSRVWRERYAALELLPAFGHAARQLRAGEESASNVDSGFRPG